MKKQLTGFVLAAVGLTSSGAHAQDFSVCFDAPVLRAPDADVLARVAGYRATLEAELKAAHWSKPAWVEAIITHESGANPKAISPTGCAGLAAICQSRRGGPHCCVKDARDGYRTIYDLCNSEEASGYRCDPATDERFNPAYSLRGTIERLRSIDARLKQLKPGDPHPVPELVVPMAYNAGLRAFPEFPAKTASVDQIMSQLDLQRGPYRTWDSLSKANKVVEIYDYLRWFPFLVEYDRKGVTAPVASKDSLLCYRSGALEKFRSVPHGSSAEATIRASFRQIEVRRLQFGKYEKASVLFAPVD